MEMQRIEAADWMGGLVYRLRFGDGFIGTVDLGAVLPVDSYVATVIAGSAAAMRVAPRGRALFCIDTVGDDVDIDAETLRGLCEDRRVAADMP